MRPIIRRGLLSLLVVGWIVAASGCGSQDDPSAIGPSDPGAQAATEAQPEGEGDGDPELLAADDVARLRGEFAAQAEQEIHPDNAAEIAERLEAEIDSELNAEQ